MQQPVQGRRRRREREGEGERVEGDGREELEASRRIMYNIIFYDISFWGALGYR